MIFIHFDPDTLAIKHVSESNHPETVAFHAKDPGVMISDQTDLSGLGHLGQVAVRRGADGRPFVHRLRKMTLLHPTAARVGEEFKIGGVPEGATIRVEGQELGVMDDSGILEMTLPVGAQYSFSFSHPHWLETSIEIEATD